MSASPFFSFSGSHNIDIRALGTVQFSATCSGSDGGS